MPHGVTCDHMSGCKARRSVRWRRIVVAWSSRMWGAGKKRATWGKGAVSLGIVAWRDDGGVLGAVGLDPWVSRIWSSIGRCSTMYVC